MEFNITRAINILARKFYTNRKTLLISAIIYFLIMSVFHYVGCMSGRIAIGGADMTLSSAMDMICIIIIAGIYPFIEFTDKKNAVFELLYPASRAEKFFTEVLTAFILLPICVIIIDILSLYTGTMAFRIHAAQKGLDFSLPVFSNIFNILGRWQYVDWMLIAGGVIISFLGAVVFKKFRVIKSWMCVGLMVSFIFAAGAFILWLNYKATGYWFPYSYSTNGYYNESTGQIVFETEAYYKGQKLDYIPWFFNGTLWKVAATLFFLTLFCCSWLRYKKERA